MLFKASDYGIVKMDIFLSIICNGILCTGCLFLVLQVIGYRLRLHIDGYSECYDFWVNADSPDIRPAGWCESTGRKLHPPKGTWGVTGCALW